MSDWVLDPAWGSKIVSPGYNSNYCLKLGGTKNGKAVFKNIAYTSDAFMLVFWAKGDITVCNYSHILVGHTVYGKAYLYKYGFPKPVKSMPNTWNKYRFVTYYNDNIGCAVLVLERWDEDNGTWVQHDSQTNANITEPKVGNVYFEAYCNNDYYTCKTIAYIDNIELYTSKSLYVTKIVSEAVENVISKQ